MSTESDDSRPPVSTLRRTATSSASAKRTESTDSTCSAQRTTARTLFRCNPPMRCHRGRAAGRSAATASTLRVASCTRFSPSRSRPRSSSAATSAADTVLVTAISATSSGPRPAAAQAAAIRRRTAASRSASSARRAADTSARRRGRLSRSVPRAHRRDACVADPSSRPVASSAAVIRSVPMPRFSADDRRVGRGRRAGALQRRPSPSLPRPHFAPLGGTSHPADGVRGPTEGCEESRVGQRARPGAYGAVRTGRAR